MKNKIISVYEKYNGACTTEDGGCRDQIVSFAREIGYSPKRGSLDCEDDRFKLEGAGIAEVQAGTNDLVGYCEYKVKVVKTDNAVNECEEKYYYRILTKIDINIPIVQNVFNLRVLNVTGDTKVFTNKTC
jgi:hypothetical protein